MPKKGNGGPESDFGLAHDLLLIYEGGWWADLGYFLSPLAGFRSTATH